MHHASSCIIMHHASSCIIMHRHASWYIVMYHHVPPSSSSSSPPPYSSSHPASSASSPVETFMAQPHLGGGCKESCAQTTKFRSACLGERSTVNTFLYTYVRALPKIDGICSGCVQIYIYIYVHIIHAYTAYIYVIYGHYIHYYTSYEKSKSSCGGSNRFRMHIDCCMLLRCKNHHLIFLAQEDNNNIFSSDIPQ